MTIMNYVRSIIVATAMICFCTAAAAQAVLPERGQVGGVRQDIFGLGFFGGPATGIGISFRHHLPGTLSYQITGGIIKVSDWISSDIGAEVQFDLARGMLARFFIAGGAGYYYSGRASHNEMGAPGRVGFGFGGEVITGSSVHALLEFIYCYFTDGTVLPLPQVGFYFYFL